MTNIIETMEYAALQDAAGRQDQWVGDYAHGTTTQLDGHYDVAGMMRAALAAIEASGYRVVPVEPTEAMIREGSYADFGHPDAVDPREWYPKSGAAECYAAMLSAAHQGDRMTRWTYELVPGAIPPLDCHALREAAGHVPHIAMPHRTIPRFLSGMKVCAGFARKYLGRNVSGLGSDYFGVAAGLATHTDNDYVQALPGTFLSVWLALADVTETNGPLVIDGKAILCKKGDAVIIDGDTPHRSCAGTGPRPVALFTYIQTGKPFRPGNTQKREEVPL